MYYIQIHIQTNMLKIDLLEATTEPQRNTNK